MSMISAAPALVNPATMSDLDFRAWLTVQAAAASEIYLDGPRPTADYGFAPTLADDAEAVELLNAEAEDDGIDLDWIDLDWIEFAEARMEAAFGDPYAEINDNELIECRGHAPSAGYDY